MSHDSICYISILIETFFLQFVCMGGSTTRMKQFAKFLQNELSDYLNDEAIKDPENLSNSDRYVVYKVGPVLAVNVSTYITMHSVFTTYE